jgi:hypothetical protein
MKRRIVSMTTECIVKLDPLRRLAEGKLMPTAHAEVRTDRGSRYLTQLCRHASHMGTGIVHRLRAHRGSDPGPRVHNADCTDTDGVIEFDRGRCVLRATAASLVLHAEADDDGQLEQIKAGIAARLHRIGRRDRLAITWS